MAERLAKYSAISAFTITLASLASSNALVGRQSTMIDNSTTKYLGAIISVNLTTGTTPTANTLFYVFLIQSDKNTTAIRDDGAGASDAALTCIQARCLGTIAVPAATSNTAYKAVFNTLAFGPLPPEWGIAVVNASQVALNSTAGNHVISWQGYTETIA